MDNQELTSIIPFEQIFVQTIHSISITVKNVILYKSAEIFVNFYDETERFLDVKMVELTGDDYLNWGSNDDYITNFVSQKLGIVFKP